MNDSYFIIYNTASSAGIFSVEWDIVQGDFKLLSDFPCPIIFKPETTKKNFFRNMKV
jgi:hypothetical protein